MHYNNYNDFIVSYLLLLCPCLYICLLLFRILTLPLNAVPCVSYCSAKFLVGCQVSTISQ